jgi:flagellar protein FlgJ
MTTSAPSTDVTARFALDSGALSALREQAKTAPGKALSAAATQFEAVFLQMMMKSMRDASPQDGPLDSEATRMYTSMFDQQIAMTMAKRGTGLSKVIETQLSRTLPAKAGDAKVSATSAAGNAMPLAAPSKAMPLTAPAKAMPLVAPGKAAGAYARTATTGTSAAPLPANALSPASAPSAGTKTSWIPDSIRSFVDKLRPAAEAAAKAIGLPVQYLLAQAGLETGWGKQQPKDAATGDSHNLFGIKAGQAWRGNVVEARTHEVVDGVKVATRAKFRSYDSYESAFGDFVKVIGHSRRYAPALAQAADPAAYATALQKGGYATDPAYAAKLARAIRSVTPLVETREPAAAQVSAEAADNRDVRT